MLDDEKSRIEELKKSLYSRNAPDIRTRRKLHVGDIESQVSKSWGGEEERIKAKTEITDFGPDKSMSFLKKFFIASLLFCILALGIGSYIFFKGSNFVSANNIDIKIDGPISIPGGEIMDFDVIITNKNNIDLQSVDMAITFPAGSIEPYDSVTELRKYTKYIGDLPTNKTVTENSKAIIFGEENKQKEILVSLTYSVKGSASVFTKTKSYNVLINSSPITVKVDGIKGVVSGQEFDTKVEVKSNSAQILRNVLLTASYPTGNSFVSSNPSAVSSDNSMWRLGDIPPGGVKTVTIKSKLIGEDEEVKVFRFQVGAQESTGNMRIGTEFATLSSNITIQKPFISLSLTVNNDREREDYITEYDRPINAELSWYNNLPVSLKNVVLVLNLSGTAYDKTTVYPGDGYFRSATNDIIWNTQTTPELAVVESGGSGRVYFSLTPKNLSNATKIVVNPRVDMRASVVADRPSESQVSGEMKSIASRGVRISSDVTLFGNVLRSIGPFTNTGPIPPKAESKTTYTIHWVVDNTSNALSGTSVKTTLPAYVKWLNNVSPNSESVSYDEITGTVSWELGNVSANTAGSSRKKEVYFQVSFEPGVDLVGQAPLITSRSVLNATDNYTGVPITATVQDLSTTLFDDPIYKANDAIVTR